MAISYSFHISAKQHALTTLNKIDSVGRHNLRLYKSDHYDRSNIDVMIGGESLRNSVSKIYHEQFDEALATYNEKQTRADREIDNYMQHVSDSNADVAVEAIVQIGDRDFWQTIPADQHRQIMAQIFDAQIEELQKLLPNFIIASAVAHYDEASPHLHIVGVPVAAGFKRGLSKQVSKHKVFTQKSLTMLQEALHAHAEKCVEAHPELFGRQTLKPKELGRNKDIPKRSLDNYYAMQSKAAQSRSEAARAIAERDVAQKAAKDAQDTQKAAKDATEQLQHQATMQRIEIERLEKDAKWWQAVAEIAKNDKSKMADELETLDDRIDAAKYALERRKESIRHADEQKLEALRARDDARAEWDVVKALQDLRDILERYIPPLIPEERIKRVEAYTTGVINKVEHPAQVVLYEDDYNYLLASLRTVTRGKALAAEIKRIYQLICDKVKEINVNKIDAQRIATDKRVKELQAELDRVNGNHKDEIAKIKAEGQQAVADTQKAGQQSVAKVQKQLDKVAANHAEIAVERDQLKADLQQAKADLEAEKAANRERTEVLECFPASVWEDLERRSRRARQMETAYDNRKFSEIMHRTYVSWHGEDVHITRFLQMYRDECNSQDVLHRTDMWADLDRLEKAERQQGRDSYERERG